MDLLGIADVPWWYCFIRLVRPISMRTGRKGRKGKNSKNELRKNKGKGENTSGLTHSFRELI